jgi:hypothetical protein
MIKKLIWKVRPIREIEKRKEMREKSRFEREEERREKRKMIGE